MSQKRLHLHSIHLYEGDFDRLRELHGTKMTPSEVVRDLVRRHIVKVEAKLQETEDARS